MGPPTTLNFPGTTPWLYLEITGIPLTEFFSGCSSDIFGLPCEFRGDGGTSSTYNELFRFTDGFLTSGEFFSATITPSVNEITPEPSSILLFLSLAPAIGFAKKRWNSRQTV
jgi:hypothetical protein